jgi:hypothetical protein
VDASLPKIRRLRATPVNVPLARPHPTASGVVSSAPLVLMDLETDQGLTGRVRGGQPFTYDLFDALMPSEFERRGSWFAESSEPPNCCWAYGITPQFRRDSIRRDPSTA